MCGKNEVVKSLNQIVSENSLRKIEVQGECLCRICGLTYLFNNYGKQIKFPRRQKV